MNELFYNINPREIGKILNLLESNTLHFKKNTTILNSVKKENIIGLVISGHIQIIKNDYNGNQTIIDELYDNDLFGFTMNTLSNSEQNIKTLEDSKIILLYFDEIISKDLNTAYFNQFLKNLLKIYYRKINDSNDRIEILTNKTIRNKLLAYFKIMSKKNKTRIIYLPYSYTDLADYIGVDRSAMYRELKSLKEDGFIEIKNKRIKLNIIEE